MSQFPSLPPPTVYLLAALAGAVVLLPILVALLARWRRNPYPYTAAPALFSPAERTFFLALRQALGDDAVVFAKVRLADLLQLERGATGKHRWRAFGRIAAKHADFVLCNPRTFRVLGVVELDDRSHQRRDRQERDEFFDRAFAAATVPVWRVPVQRFYPAKTLREQAAAFLTAAGKPR